MTGRGTTKTGAGATKTGLGATNTGATGTPTPILKKTLVLAIEVTGTKNTTRRTVSRNSLFISHPSDSGLYLYKTMYLE
ncbi:MAG TPA: hypothetical protein VNK81_04755 [Thermodesulfobacteriota bacterium]|jgi:hypothetical protein|nr:hypothetical protein [Thermodesulfobacteriota bacterium]